MCSDLWAQAKTGMLEVAPLSRYQVLKKTQGENWTRHKYSLPTGEANKWSGSPQELSTSASQPERSRQSPWPLKTSMEGRVSQRDFLGVLWELNAAFKSSTLVFLRVAGSEQATLGIQVSRPKQSPSAPHFRQCPKFTPPPGLGYSCT